MIAAVNMVLRQFQRRPTVAFVTILVLGLGTAAAATVFTIVDTVVLMTGSPRDQFGRPLR